MFNEQKEEINILAKIASGDQDAFRSVFMQYYPKTKYFIAHIVKSEDVAEDLAQDIFLKVWISRDHLLHLRSFNAYIYTMAKNAALNFLDHKSVEKAFVVNYRQSDVSSPEEELNAKELELLIEVVINQMPEQRRKIYQMSRVENIKNGKIAEDLGLSVKTVNNQLSLALKEIRDIVTVTFLFFL